MKRSRSILLTQGKKAIVDARDYHFLCQWSWCAVKKGHNWYASRGLSNGTTIFMHRQIADRAGFLTTRIDHIDRNGLNNRRCNLRPATQSQNTANARMWCNNTSGYRGVTYDKAKRSWQAGIKRNQRFIFLGRYSTPEKAAAAYNRGARRLFGKFAFHNHLPTGTTGVTA